MVEEDRMLTDNQGVGHMSRRQAEIVLGVGRQTLNSWLDEGVLPTVDVGGQQMVDARAVGECRQLLVRFGQTSRVKLVERMALLEIRLRRLERQVRGLAIIYQAPATASLVHLEDGELWSIFVDARRQLSSTSHSAPAVRKWAAIVGQLSELEFSRLAIIGRQPRPWKVFLRLINSMIADLHLRTVGRPDEESQQLAFALTTAKTRLTTAILVHVRADDQQGGEERALSVYYQDSAQDRLLRFLP